MLSFMSIQAEINLLTLSVSVQVVMTNIIAIYEDDNYQIISVLYNTE